MFFFSTASRRTRLCVWMRSWLLVNCYGFRQHQLHHFGSRGWHWSGCYFRCFPQLHPQPYRTSAFGWVIGHPPIQSRRSGSWKTGTIRNRCRSTDDTARSWSGSGSSGSGCPGMEAAGRCGSGWRWAYRPHSDPRCQCWTGWWSRWSGPDNACASQRNEEPLEEIETGKTSSAGTDLYLKTQTKWDFNILDYKKSIRVWVE